MAEHTPGPWFYGMGYTVRQSDEGAAKSGRKWGHSIAAIRCDPPCPPPLEIEANGFLISAAPELLAALEVCEAHLEWNDCSLCNVHDMARAAIAKAKGESYDQA